MAKKNRFDASFDRADAAFNAKYGAELAQLKGLTPEQIAAISPGTEGKEAYAALVSVVQKASLENTAKAEMFNNIKSIGGNIGGVALNMARQFIPGFA